MFSRLTPRVAHTAWHVQMDGIVHIADWYGTFVHMAGSDDLYDARAGAIPFVCHPHCIPQLAPCMICRSAWLVPPMLWLFGPEKNRMVRSHNPLIVLPHNSWFDLSTI
jgi:hypothetical protein